MKIRLFLLVAASVTCASTALAEDVRYVEKDGVTYREVVRRIQRPMTETRVEERAQTVYREQYVTESRPSVKTVYRPVTEYQLEARWHGVLNPFVRPYVGYHYVPRTRWEQETHEVPVTVTRREVVPETRTVQVPILSRRMVEDEVVTRTAVSSTGRRTASVVSRGSVGGVAELQNDPPKRPSGNTVTR